MWIRDVFELFVDERDEFVVGFCEIGYVNVSDFVDYVDHVVSLIGIDYVGLSSDFDGGGGIVDWFDVGETFNVILEFVC